MSIEYIRGDLLDFPAEINVIAHGCNGKGVMGSGIAKSIKERYPVAFEVYEEEFKNRGLQLGTFTVGQLPDGKKIANLVVQEEFGREEGRKYVDYEAFYIALKTLRDALEHAQKEGRNYVLGLPHNISCGLAGGDWCVIKGTIECLFFKSPIRCVVVELENKQDVNPTNAT